MDQPIQACNNLVFAEIKSRVAIDAVVGLGGCDSLNLSATPLTSKRNRGPKTLVVSQGTTRNKPKDSFVYSSSVQFGCDFL